MAASDDEPEPDAKRPCSPVMVLLQPLKGVGNIRERYTEDTADVFFVEKETKERLPAHREVLKVASTVFFKMFDGDWKEKKKNEIPAPEEYNWESLKAAITLLYGEEVEVEESSIPDIYRVAHLYDLREVITILVHEIHQWGSDMVKTVLELCVLAQDYSDSGNVLNAARLHIACSLEEVNPLDIVRLSFESMQSLAESENIVSAELVLLRILNHWTNAQSDISLKQTKQLYSHIRFGTIPYESLAECSVIGHDNLKLALENHLELSVDRLRCNLDQVTPRADQEEVFQVYPMVRGVRPVVHQNGQIEVCLPPQHTASPASAGILYCGIQEIRFQMDLKREASKDKDQSFCSTLFSLRKPRGRKAKDCVLEQRCPFNHAEGPRSIWQTATLNFLHCTVVLNQSGAHITLRSDLPKDDGDPCATMNMELPFFGRFPWVLTFGWHTKRSNSPPLMLTIHPPNL